MRQYVLYFILLITFILFLTNCKDNRSVKPGDEEIPYQGQSDHFSFYYKSLTLTQIEPVIDYLEDNYSRIIDDLKLTSMPGVKVKIWEDVNDFMITMEETLGVQYPGAYGYVTGINELRVLYRVDVKNIILHEFVHVACLNINDTFANNPRWLWETVAVYESGDFIHPNQLSYMVEGDYPSLFELNNDYNTGNRKMYELGYVIGEFIVETWGRDSLVQLIENNGDIQLVLDISESEFENQMYEFIENRYLN